mmetsp:Transcript_39646/g.119083  ORF Transcript_39646/g.119083 Transcript_39646/m.119083 type:complete len:266 (-) Transcript_39646:568-1365(-)
MLVNNCYEVRWCGTQQPLLLYSVLVCSDSPCRLAAVPPQNFDTHSHKNFQATMTKHSMVTFPLPVHGAMPAEKETAAADAAAKTAALAARNKSKSRKRKPSTEMSKHEDEKSKYILQYNPETDRPMTKEQITEWRKQQRKERNRASAAASRDKIRGRIRELEGEVDDLQSKYASALERIQQLEAERANVSTSFHAPLHLQTQATNERHPHAAALPAMVSAEDSPHLSPKNAPQATLSTLMLRGSPSDVENNEIKPHVIETNSRQA